MLSANAHESGKSSAARALPFVLLFNALAFFSAPTVASPQSEADAIPHVNATARENYLAYTYAGQHKAFAIAPGGAWAWSADALSEGEAERQALSRCRANTRQECILYALNGRVVFDAKRWSGLWGPYSTKQQAREAGTGVRIGQRFHDLAFKDSAGRPLTLSGLRGKVVIVHFWGSWCPPCMRELPSVKRLHELLSAKLPGKVAFVLLQAREPFGRSRQWVEDNDLTGLPLYDSGTSGEKDTALSLANGENIEDRKIAPVFPSTYVLDKNGVVVFTHYGPITDWREYAPFFKHAVLHSK